ncbi:MAG: mechanosensitive ion channel family protein [Vulcanisaeta sp.]|nr:mechanosensitive ion channel family protein [Vulcanisaeta sp.]MCG2869329.1 mechanosensitive ion channel family protein [Vulcanisaeta sp.]MCG2880988.1 mechanosensitive ion channel family protein [Vulcanisaeta sp.]
MVAVNATNASKVGGFIPSGVEGLIIQALIIITVAVAVYLLLDYVFDKIVKAFVKITRKGDVENARFIFRIILIVTILSAIAYIYGQYLIVGALLIIVAIILVIGMKPIIEEYFTGKMIKLVRDYSLDIGDHVDIMGIKGYVIKQTSLGVIIRSSRNELVYIPYTLIMKNVVKRVPPTEGIEVRIPFKIPRDDSLIEDIRDELLSYMEDLGLEDPHVDVAAIEDRYIELIARGTYKDLRTIDDVKYAVLNKVLELTLKYERRRGNHERP